MTAIAGHWDFAGGGAGAACGRMLAAQEMYGRDGTLHSGPGDVAIGRALSLSLFEDMFDRGVQRGAGGRWTLAADIRLDNRDDLIAALGLDPARLCDAAVAMAAIERWGEDAIARLIGDFALILWDAAERRLLLARDYIGARPLYYHVGRGFAAVASMPKGLHALPDIPRAPDEAVMIGYLAGLPERGAASFYAGISRVEPGRIVTITPDTVRARQYWTLPETRISFADAADYEEGLRAEIDRATAACLRRASGGVAAHLSAGLDSSVVAASAARLLGEEPLLAFTGVPAPGTVPDTGILADEGPLAALVAAMHPNIDHHLVHSAGESPLDRLDRAFTWFDRPVPNICNFVWADRIGVAARAAGASVLLTGQIGNVTISHDGTTHLPDLFGRGRLGALYRMGRGLTRTGMRWRGVATMAAGPFLPPAAWRWLARRTGVLPPVADHAMLAPDVLARVASGVTERQPWRDGRARRLDLLSGVEVGSYHKGLLAGHGLDYRDPTADRRVLEYCLAIPEEQFLLGGVQRSLARRSFADRLPQALLQERRKGRQGMDWHVGMAAAAPEIAAQVERLAATRDARFLDLDRMRDAAARIMADPTVLQQNPIEYRTALLRGLSVGHFARRASGSNR